jgi:hypothetical protein
MQHYKTKQVLYLMQIKNGVVMRAVKRIANNSVHTDSTYVYRLLEQTEVNGWNS